jgi:hypothetical protein
VTTKPPTQKKFFFRNTNFSITYRYKNQLESSNPKLQGFFVIFYFYKKFSLVPPTASFIEIKTEIKNKILRYFCFSANPKNGLCRNLIDYRKFILDKGVKIPKSRKFLDFAVFCTKKTAVRNLYTKHIMKPSMKIPFFEKFLDFFLFSFRIFRAPHSYIKLLTK